MSGGRVLSRREDGFALPMALGISVVLLILLTAIIDYSSQNLRSSRDSGQRQLAYKAAETGMNNAISVLLNSGAYHSSSALPSVSNVSAGPDGVTYSYTGTLVDPVWTVTVTGKAPNKTQGSKVVTRTMTRKLSISTAAAGGVNTTVWNYIYSDTPPGGTCLNLANNASIGTPFYIRGDLCMGNNSNITKNVAFTTNFPNTPQVQVGGKITLNNNAFIGTSAAPLNGVQTGQGCGSTPHNPCTSADAVWANSYLTTVPNLAKPVIDLATWYNDAAPGPKHACTSGSFPSGFDNNTVQDNSNGTIDLTPNSTYDCKFVDGLGNTLGRIAWDNSAKTLTIAGTLFFDGNGNFSQSVVYSGRATLYFAGTVSLGGGNVCGIASCTSSWNSTNNLMVLVSGSNNQSPSFAINLNNNAQFQGAVECNGDFNESNNVGVWGSVIAHQVYIANNAIDTYVPFGTPVPGMPAQTGYTETLVVDPGTYTG